MNWNQLQQWTWNWILWVKAQIVGLRNRICTDETRISKLETNSITRKDFMAAIDDLKAEYEQFKTLVLAAIASLAAKVASMPPDDSAAVAALKDEIAADIAALPPAP